MWYALYIVIKAPIIAQKFVDTNATCTSAGAFL